MIKSNASTSDLSTTSKTCFEKSLHGPQLGILFEKKDGCKRIAPNSFLSAVDFDGSDELLFHYTGGTITVKGNALHHLWEHLCKGLLVRLSEGEIQSIDSPWVKEIIFPELGISNNEPLFPR